MLDNSGNFLTEEQVIALSKTKQGKAQVQQYLLRGRAAYTLQCIFEALDIIPSTEQQQLVSEVFWRCMFDTPTANILIYIDSFKEHVDKNSINGVYLSDDKAGHC
jgi:propanediol dehydratase large subunit